jgi:hypothetical protein
MGPTRQRAARKRRRPIHLAIGTRFYAKDRHNDHSQLHDFIKAAMRLGRVYVAVDTERDTSDALRFICSKEYGDRVVGFEVTPWQGFVPALNAIVYRAAVDGMDNLLLASVDCRLQKAVIQRLSDFMGPNTLVAGARLKDHKFKVGTRLGSGLTVPWSTFAIWNVRHLALLGFPLVGDAPFDSSNAGVEEVTAIALFQKIYGSSGAQAYLVDVPGSDRLRNMQGWDETRIAQHKSKIQSKEARPAKQLVWTGLEPPTVIHVSAENRGQSPIS